MKEKTIIRQIDDVRTALLRARVYGTTKEELSDLANQLNEIMYKLSTVNKLLDILRRAS